jgi:hypothetical protein
MPKLNRFGSQDRSAGKIGANSRPGSHHKIASGRASAPLAYFRHSRNASASAFKGVVISSAS